MFVNILHSQIRDDGFQETSEQYTPRLDTKLNGTSYDGRYNLSWTSMSSFTSISKVDVLDTRTLVVEVPMG
jgi:hypothetical protein